MSVRVLDDANRSIEETMIKQRNEQHKGREEHVVPHRVVYVEITERPLSISVTEQLQETGTVRVQSNSNIKLASPRTINSRLR